MELKSLIHVSEVCTPQLVREAVAHICYPFKTHWLELVIDENRDARLDVIVEPLISPIIVQPRRHPEMGPPRFG